ncbi:Group 3 truncated hemoglobin ctb [Rickettsiales bacterium Ac37b]|nr:Group 3 truncated hemoglobin ctb [Rickettsiales bacterium Ac37b]
MIIKNPPSPHSNMPAITESMIKELVYNFYEEVRNDDLIGNIFEKIIDGNWDEHLSRMCDFWSSIILSTARYKGQPLLKHLNIPNLNQEHFLRWLHIFEKHAYNIFPKDVALSFVHKAYRIANNLMLGIEFHNKNLNLL